MAKKARRMQLQARKLGQAVPPAPQTHENAPVSAHSSGMDVAGQGADDSSLTIGPLHALPSSKRTAKRRASKKRAHARKAEAERQCPKKPRAKPSQSSTGRSSAALGVVHEDAHVLVVNKPAGLLCHPSPGFWHSGTVVHELPGRERLPGFSPISDEMMAERLSYTGEADSAIPRAIVHRLDRGTTGVLLIAKTARAEEHLANQFRSRTTRKRYVALLHGTLQASKSSRLEQDGGLYIDAPIGRALHADARGAMVVEPSGKPAQSTLHVHAIDESRRVVLVSVDLHTGRQHQIRVHCAHLGAPVANDDVYGDGASAFRACFASASLRRGRPLLHAWSLSVAHPHTAARLEVAAPLPPDMRRLVSELWPSIGLDPAEWPRVAMGRNANGAAATALPSSPAATGHQKQPIKPDHSQLKAKSATKRKHPDR